MTYKYKDYVHVCKMELDKNKDCRFLIVYNLDGGNKSEKALIIMKNPSKANFDISDQTINNVLEYMHEFRYSKVYIMNLIPIYGTNSKDVKDDLFQKTDILKKNDSLICEISRKVSKIFVAWGGKSSFNKEYYNSRIISVKKCLKDKTLYCYSINKVDKQPTHPGYNRWKKGKLEDEFVIYK